MIQRPVTSVLNTNEKKETVKTLRGSEYVQNLQWRRVAHSKNLGRVKLLGNLHCNTLCYRTKPPAEKGYDLSAFFRAMHNFHQIQIVEIEWGETVSKTE